MSIYVLQDQTKQHSNENGWYFLSTHHPQYVTPVTRYEACAAVIPYCSFVSRHAYGNAVESFEITVRLAQPSQHDKHNFNLIHSDGYIKPNGVRVAR